MDFMAMSLISFPTYTQSAFIFQKLKTPIICKILIEIKNANYS